MYITADLSSKFADSDDYQAVICTPLVYFWLQHPVQQRFRHYVHPG